MGSVSAISINFLGVESISAILIDSSKSKHLFGILLAGMVLVSLSSLSLFPEEIPEKNPERPRKRSQSLS